MSRGRIAFFLLSLALLVPLLSSGLRRALAAGAGEDSLYKQLSVFSEVLHLVRRAYVDEVSPETLLAGALDGAADALDPLSTFVPAEALVEYAQARAVGSAHSGLTVVKERGITLVVAVAPGSPGADAGVEARDALVKIDGAPTRRMPLWRIQSILAGGPDSRLTMELVRRGQPVEVELVLTPFARRPAVLEEREGEAVLRLFDCEPATGAETQQALEAVAAAGRQRLLVDLRGVADGDPSVAYRIGELFAAGKLGALLGRSGEVAEFESSRQPLWQGPLVVLIDRGTMGCSEVLAAILKQSAGAVFVGQPSFGHAGRLELLPLTGGARLATTDAFYTGPDGRALAEALMPDNRVSEFSRRFGEGERPLADMILERGLELLKSLEPGSSREAA